MKTIEAYQTSDGQLFNDKQAAERHEEFLSSKAVIEVFLDSDLNPYKGYAQRAIARNTVINWSIWQNKK